MPRSLSANRKKQCIQCRHVEACVSSRLLCPKWDASLPHGRLEQFRGRVKSRFINPMGGVVVMEVSPSPHVPNPMIVRHGRGFPILFVHGSGVDHRILLPLDSAFRGASQWERIYIDLPGFGKTPSLDGPGGLGEMADWLDATVESLFGQRHFALLGNSLGGLLARELLARRPQQVVALALLATVVDPHVDKRRLLSRVIVNADHQLIASIDPEYAQMFISMAVQQRENDWERFRQAALPGILSVDREAIERLEARYELPGPSPENRIGHFNGPTLIIAGRQDHVVGYDDQVGLFPYYTRATFAILDGAGHNVHLEQPEEVMSLLTHWQQEAIGAFLQQ